MSLYSCMNCFFMSILHKYATHCHQALRSVATDESEPHFLAILVDSMNLLAYARYISLAPHVHIPHTTHHLYHQLRDQREPFIVKYLNDGIHLMIIIFIDRDQK